MSQSRTQAITSSDIRERVDLLLIELSARFVSLPADRVDSEIESGQQKVCEFLGFDRCTLVERPAHEPSSLEITHIYQRASMPQTPKRTDLGLMFPWVLQQLRQGKLVAISKLDDLPAEAASDKDMLRKYGTHSVVVIPFSIANVLHGALTFASAHEVACWPEATLTRLKLIAEIFSGALSRARIDRELRESEKRLSVSLAEVRHLRDQLLDQNTHLRREMKQLSGNRRVIGESRPFRHALELAEQVAPTNSTVLLLGETGTGKGVIASRIHELSPRRGNPMVCVNCAAIPALLLESELFGREKGAYTGALSRQVGRFELAHGSTLFLDEIGELPIELQVKLLRALEDKEIERLGSPKPIHVDVRVIAATNRDLQRSLQERTFREDLYYRLSAFPITVPPLRERPEDIPLLVSAFVGEFATSFGKRIEYIAKEGMEALLRYGWPGNVRELRNVVERAMIIAKGPELSISPPVELTPAPLPGFSMESVERDHIRRVLELTGGRIRGKKGAAVTLGLKPTTLESRMAKLGMSRRELLATK